LRGLCIFDAANCRFSHGVQDLDYQFWNSEEAIEYDYLKETDFNQNKTIKAPIIYKDLYEFQTEKIFTLDQLYEDKKKRDLIRKMFHKQMFYDFIKLLEEKYPEGRFT
jgi:hypothetical protein